MCGSIRTEADTLPEDIDIDAQERRQASREQQVEAGDPSANHGTLLQSLLRELPLNDQ